MDPVIELGTIELSGLATSVIKVLDSEFWHGLKLGDSSVGWTVLSAAGLWRINVRPTGRLLLVSPKFEPRPILSNQTNLWIWVTLKTLREPVTNGPTLDAIAEKSCAQRCEGPKTPSRRHSLAGIGLTGGAHGSNGGSSSVWLGSTPAGSVCRLSLRESTFAGGKVTLRPPAHVTRETRNLNHAIIGGIVANPSFPT